MERELQAADLAKRKLQTSVLAAPPEPDLEVPAYRIVKEGSSSLKRKQGLRHWKGEFSPEATN